VRPGTAAFGASQRVARSPSGARLAGLRRLFATGAGIAVLAACVWGGARFYRSLDVPVAVIAVEGTLSQVSREELENLVAANIEGGFLGMDLQRIRAALAGHPWIEVASVRRQWPDRLRIRVVEEIPIARWGETGFLNRRGEDLYAPRVNGLDALPLLAGPPGSARRVMTQYRDVNQLLQPMGLKIVEFREAPRGDWQLSFANGTALKLGRDRLIDKLKRFQVAWNGALASRVNDIEQVDIRYENGVAVRWRADQERQTL